MNCLKFILSKCGTSIGAYYREANRSRSKAEFKSKIRICETEASETQYWLEIVRDLGWVPRERLESDLTESSELLAIFISISKTTSL
jgi:four helix bundle protein